MIYSSLDFFRASLKASREVSSRSRTLLAQQCSRDCGVELTFKLLPLKMKTQMSEESSSSSSSSCVNGVWLQRKAVERRNLSQLPDEQEISDASLLFLRAPLRPDMELETSDTSAETIKVSFTLLPFHRLCLLYLRRCLTCPVCRRTLWNLDVRVSTL